MDESALLAEQIRYYRARAPEYDDWFLRRGAYDRGADANAAWFAEVAEVEAALASVQPPGPTLELACGTGLWTRRLVEHAEHVVAVDASREVIALNRARVASPRVRYVEANLFEWAPDETFAFVFLGFWLSHVPAARFDAFWSGVAAVMRRGGRVFFVDNRVDGGLTRRRDGVERVERVLADGRRYEIVKVLYEPETLASRLRALGFEARIHETARSFIYGWADRTG